MMTNFGLTEKGKEEIREIALKNYQEFSKADRIIFSPYKRTLETAEIISDIIDKGVDTDQTIYEFNSGILAGKTHEENAVLYPDFYRIWKERKDLDGIPGAETGRELQARALAFLMKYEDKDNYNEIIVSHAGFLRCLINTAKGRIRTTPVDSKNGAVTVLEDPLDKLQIEHKSRAMASKVFTVKTADDKYVVKMKNRPIKQDDIEEKKLLEDLKFDVENLPQVLSLLDNKDGTCTKVLSFVEGESIFGKLSEEQENALIEKVLKIREALSFRKQYNYQKENLYKIIEQLELTSKRTYIKNYAKRILEDKKNIAKLENSEYCLAHNDLNRDNILFFVNKNGKQEVNIIDWEGVGNFPKDYQLASFLASAILIEGYEVSDTMRIAERFDKIIDKDFITYLMKIRVFTGLHYFVENRNIYTQNNKETSKEIIRKYFFAAEKLEQYRIRNGFDPVIKKNNFMELKLDNVFDGKNNFTNEEREEI